MPPRVAIGWTPTRSSSPPAAPTLPRACSAAWEWPEACPRPPSVDRAGGRSQVSGLSAAAIAIVAIILIAPALSILPKAVLSAIVINAVWGLLDLGAIRRYMKMRRNDGIAAVVAAGAVLIAGPMLGLAIAIGAVPSRNGVPVESGGRGGPWQDPGREGGLGRRAPTSGARHHSPASWCSGSTCRCFGSTPPRSRRRSSRRSSAAPDTKALILNLESTDQLETTSADMLSELREQLAERNVDLYLVRVRWRVRTVLAHSGLRERLGEDHLWHNVAQGIREARRQHGIERPGHPEPEPIVDEAEEEIIATPTFDDEPWSEATRRLP